MRNVALLGFGLGFVACSGDDSPAGTAGKGGAGSSGRAATAGASGSSGSAAAGRGAGGAATGGTGTAGSGVSGGSSGSLAAGGTAGAGGAAGRAATGGGAGRAGAGSGGDAGANDAGAAGDASGSGGKGGSGGGSTGDGYDAIVLADGPVAYWAMNHVSGTEPDLTPNGRDGSHEGTVDLAELPNGDMASDFDGESQFVTVPSHASFSISTTGNMTWEAWIRPRVLQFPNDSNGYVNWMGKCAGFSQNCEWEARMYSTENGEDRCNRISAYVFNQSAGLGSAADWQPECGLIEAGSWYHVVGEYTTESEPSDCQNADQYPGSIEIWVNGVQWDHGSHGQTGCMSQYDVSPGAYDSPLNIGTMSEDDWFPGAIGKVAIYDKLLPEADILEHYTAMTGEVAQGDCGGTCNFD